MPDAARKFLEELISMVEYTGSYKEIPKWSDRNWLQETTLHLRRLLEQNERLERELDTERSMRHEAQSDYGNQMDKVEQLEADNATLQKRVKFLEEKVADYKDRLKAALMKPQWDRKQK